MTAQRPTIILVSSVVNPHHTDAGPDSTYPLGADPDKDPDFIFYLMRFRIFI
jgi:hypothetical protein